MPDEVVTSCADHRERREALLLSSREDALLQLLADGHTDMSAARWLSVSPRTVTNMVRSLMDRWGVNSRFQLGLAVGADRAVAQRCCPQWTRER